MGVICQGYDRRCMACSRTVFAINLNGNFFDFGAFGGGGVLNPGNTYAAADNGAVALGLRDTYPETVTINAVSGAATAVSGTALASASLNSVRSASCGFMLPKQT